MQMNGLSTDVSEDEALYRELFMPLFRYLFFRTSDHEVANDLTQAVFLKFLLQKERPREREPAHRLLFTIARTTLIDHYRVRGRRVTVSIDTVPEFASDSPNPEEEAIKNEDKQFISAALAQLSHLEADIVSLRLSGDVSHETIAEVAGVSVANARQIYSRALKKVGGMLNPHDFLT
ncbi:MAG TPA: RNA polymerase sigma factor [Candidatus Paceibacterota bacterium]|nr:RNA polymerase sigma factor [Candidatus Paceibacterota bacterium]